MIKLIAGSLLLSAICLGDSVSYSSTCQSHGVPPVIGNTTCSSTPYGPFAGNAAIAQSSVSLALAPTPAYSNITGTYSAGLNVVDVSQSAIATIDGQDADNDHIFGYTTRAETNLSYAHTLTTLSSGFGFIHVVIPSDTGLATDDTGQGSATINLTGGLLGYPSLSATCGAAYDAGNSGCEQSADYFRHFPYIPFQLGQNFTISANAVSEAASDLQLGNGYAAYDFTYQFQVFGPDLVTPIQVVEAVPEPSSLALALIGSLLGFPLYLMANRKRADSVKDFPQAYF